MMSWRWLSGPVILCSLSLMFSEALPVSLGFVPCDIALSVQGN